MNKQLDVLMHKEMTRKEFLATLGFGVASVLGFGSLIRLMSSKGHGGHLRNASVGYGSSAYGGGKD